MTKSHRLHPEVVAVNALPEMPGDSLKNQMPLRHIDGVLSWQAGAATALSEINEWLTVFAIGGASLGYNGGAAIGVKLTAPDKQSLRFVKTDASCSVSRPNSVHQFGRRWRLSDCNSGVQLIDGFAAPGS